jgi:ABC-type glycerol-3-phosphate transport system permease component
MEMAVSKPGRSWWRRNGGTILCHGIINLFMLLVLLPLIWVLLMSVRSRTDAMRSEFWPNHFDFTHYGYVFSKIDTIPRNFANSVYVTSGTVLFTTVFAVLAGYALVHLRPPGGRLVMLALFASLYFPVRVVSLLSIYETQHVLGLINSTSGLILPYITLNLAASVFIMRGVFQYVPRDVIEAATIDGAGPWRALWAVGLPMARNGLLVVLILNFVTAWGEYLLCLTLTNDQTARTIPVVLAGAQGGLGQWSWPNLAAVYVVVISPGVLAFIFAQKWFFKGLFEGSLKG